jgi:glutamate racemase
VVDDFVKLLKELREEQGCSQIILGCTELPLIIAECLKVYPGLKSDNLVDSTEVMVETCVKLCKRDIDVYKLLEQLETPSELERSTATEDDDY